MELRPCLGQGASLGEEAISADSGREGEVAARVGRVRSLAFLSILLMRWREHRDHAQRAAGPAGNFHRQGDHVESPMRKIA